MTGGNPKSLKISESVIGRLWSAAGPVPGIRLRSEAGETVLEEPPPRPSVHASRYSVEGEIARGGVGIVLKGHDVDLGRELAMKVIRPEYAKHPEVLRRFIEEAQVGAQLQHPGIVPVYEFGHDEDRRAFFTMKLIRGGTFAAMLAAREDPAEERRRFLSIFEQICQTVAYAHARGVIHRDLKPANVMVGSFGEVQVVDWGFAKVMERKEDRRPEDSIGVIRTIRSGSQSDASRVGSVMGTPPYMPPEQATGQTDLVDERADVFALGSILIEILTGHPAYREQGTAGLRQAVKYDTDDAMARLADCPADEELVDLCRRCTAKEIEDRPRNADAVARAVADYLTGVEERARAAEMLAETERVKAVEERRAKMLTIGLAAAVILAVLLGGGGYFLVQAAQRKNAEQVAGLVNDDVKQASALRGAAQGARFDLPRWDAAVAAATRAAERAVSHEAKPVDLSRAEALLADVTEEAERAKRNDRILNRLAEIRLARDNHLDFRSADLSYAEAFAAFGVRETGTDLNAVAAEIRASGVAKELAAYLDEWLFIRGTVDRPRDHLLAIAMAVDPDLWRGRFRRAAIEKNESELIALAANADLTGNSPNLLARHLTLAERRPEAVELLRRAHRERPQDFWLSYDLGYELTMLVPPLWEEAIGYFRVALSTRPKSREVRHQLGIALLKADQPDEALAVFEETLRDRPDYIHLYDHIVEWHEMRGELPRLIGLWRSEAETSDQDPVAWYRLGRACEAAMDTEGMKSAYGAAAALVPDSALYEERLGFAHLYAKENEDALKHFTRALELDPEMTGALHGKALIRFTELDFAGAIKVLEEALRRDPYQPFHRYLLAIMLEEQGNLAEARTVYDQALAVYPDTLTAVKMIGNLLASEGDYDGAIEKFQLAVKLPDRLTEARFIPGFRSFNDLATGRRRVRVTVEPMNQLGLAWARMGIAHRFRGRAEEATKAFLEARKHMPDLVWVWSSLAETARETGDLKTAAECYEFCLEHDDDPYWIYFLAFVRLGQGDHAEGAKLLDRFGRHVFMTDAPRQRREDWARVSAVALRLAREMPAIRSGERTWESPEECAIAGWMCMEMGYSALAARLVGKAIAEDPSIAGRAVAWPAITQYASYAATGALLASIGQDHDEPDPTDEEKARWRKKALDWMRLDLEQWERRADPKEEARMIREWLSYLSWGLVREEQNLAEIPADEADAWRAIWKRCRTRLAELESREK